MYTMKCCTSVLLVLILCSAHVSGSECSREQSRLVRYHLLKHVTPVFSAHDVKMQPGCPWNLQTDIYGLQEEHKYEDSANRWVCQFCGKSFYEERFLDLHFLNRHSQSVRAGAGAQCIADACDVFRCDVMRKRHVPEYWDVALCKERDLQRRMHKCERTLKACIPPGTANSTSTKIYDTVWWKVCSYLTCDTYWQLPEPESSPLAMAAYVMGSVALSVFLFIYYYLACAHFYSDDSIFDPTHERKRHLAHRPFFIPQGISTRKRHTHRKDR